MNRLRAILRNWLLGSTAAPPPVVPDDRPVRTGMTVSTAARWEANRTGAPAALPNQLFERPKPPAGVLPAGMAMDSLPAVANLAAWGLQSVFHEGLAFPGYAYLAELAQRPEYRHMAEIWAEHATRKWIKLTGPDDVRLGVIEAEMERLNVRSVFRHADEVDGCFGRSHIYLDFGDGERSQRLLVDPRKVTPQRPLRALRVVEPMWVYPGLYEAGDPLHPDFYRPRFWYVQGRTVADSRLLTFTRHPVPDMLKPSYAFGGQSYTQLAKPYVDNWLRTRQSVSDVTSAFSQMVLSTDMASTLQGGSGADLYARVDMFNRTRDNRGTMVINKESEELANVTTPLSGLDALQAQSQEQLSSVARIPLSIYLQVTPTGLNASSEGEIRSFYADVTAHQEKDYRPALQRVLELVQLSIDGTIDPDVKFTFEPLWEMSAVDAATVRKTEADTDAVYVTMGAVSNEEVREKLREEDGGPYQGVNLDGEAQPPADEPDDEDEPTGAQDGFDPSEPRDADGKWASAGSNASKVTALSSHVAERLKAIDLPRLEISHSVNRDGQNSSYLTGQHRYSSPDGKASSIVSIGVRVSDHAVSSNRVDRDSDRIQYYLDQNATPEQVDRVFADIERRKAEGLEHAKTLTGRIDTEALAAAERRKAQESLEDKAAQRSVERAAYFAEQGIDLGGMTKTEAAKLVKAYNRDHSL